MPKDFSVDYSALHTQLTKKAYKLSEVRDQIERVAFDIVRFKDGDKGAELWQIQDADDGQYIVAIYEDQGGVEKTASKNPWEVFVGTGGSLQISYKGDPIVSLASTSLGIPAKEIGKVPEYLPEKLASNGKLVLALLKQVSGSAREALIKKYPELSCTEGK